MSTPPVDQSDFFVAGGALRAGAVSYVRRVADDELYEAALAGEFCYVLTPRQMGKTSLMVHTVQRLRSAGVQTAIVDLTSIGVGVTPEQWYLGLITRIKSQLRLTLDVNAWWAERASLGAVQRFGDFLGEAVLAEVAGRVVIFVDEIDTTLSVAFSDDFFAAVRAVYIARAQDERYSRLTFVFLGVATPSDLIKDRQRTPFNIGREINLYEFTRVDASVLERGLDSVYAGQGRAILDRIFFWTNGHPYLTQKLCLTIVEAGAGIWDSAHVDALVEQLFLSEEARKETNLQFVRDKVLEHSRHTDLLALYSRIYRGRVATDDKQSLLQNQLKLSGLVKVESGTLRVRNEVYRRVFDAAWIRRNTPTNWPRVVAALAVLVALIVIGILVNDVWVQRSVQDELFKLYAPSAQYSDTQRMHALAFVFSARGIVLNARYDEQGVQAFYGLSRADQLNLFLGYETPQMPDAEVVPVIERLQTTLADVDNDDSNTELLQAMQMAAERRAPKLAQALQAWVSARESLNIAAALQHYDTALTLYPDNPATRFERARVRALVGDATGALEDLDRVMAIAAREGAASTETPTATPTVTSTPTDTPPPFATLGAIVPAPCAHPAGWSTVIVQPGETLSRLAILTGTTVTALQIANCLPSDIIFVGQVLSVPYSPTEPMPLPTLRPVCTLPPLTWLPYVVQAGDTLYSIAVRFGTSVEDLRRVNCMWTYYVIIGQTLFVPPHTQASATPLPPEPPPPPDDTDTPEPPPSATPRASETTPAPSPTRRTDESFASAFSTRGERTTAVRRLLLANPALVQALADVAVGVYPNLEDAGLKTTGIAVLTSVVVDIMSVTPGLPDVATSVALTADAKPVTPAAESSPTPTPLAEPPTPTPTPLAEPPTQTPTPTRTPTPLPITPTSAPTKTPTVPAGTPKIVRVYNALSGLGNSDIFVEYSDGRITNLTNDSANDGYPDLSPSESRIVFTSNLEGSSDLYLINLDGSGRVRISTYTGWDIYSDTRPAWLSDTKIVFESDRTDNREIYVMNADGTATINLTNNPGTDCWPTLSSGRIHFYSDRSGSWAIYSMQATGADVVVLQANVTPPAECR